VSNLQGSNKSYSLTLSPSSILNNTISTITLQLPANTIQDVNGRSNITNSSIFTWNYDTTKPQLQLSSTKSNDSSSDDPFIVYTINSDKDISSIDLNSFEVVNASIFGLQGSGKIFTVNLAPSSALQTSIYVKANSVTDNTNNTNNVNSNQFYWTYNGNTPLITIKSNDIDLNTQSSSS
jgi:hypothetical protein